MDDDHAPPPKRPRPRRQVAATDAAATVIETVQAFLDRWSGALSQNSGLPRAWWHACLLCFSDRYGSGKVLTPSAFHPLHVPPDARLEMLDTIRLAALWTKKLRMRLAQRTDCDRVQMQRPLLGTSLICFTTSRAGAVSAARTKALNALLVAALHPTLGVEDVRMTPEQFRGIPFKLPVALQPKLPCVGRDTAPVPATAINALLRALVTAHAHQRRADEQDGGQTPNGTPACDAFIRRLDLGKPQKWACFGDLPDEWDEATMGFETVVPPAHPGTLVIWSTWHTTCGVARVKNAAGQVPPSDAKITAFVDHVPRDFLGPELLAWYTYVARHAPCDPGAGSSRGTWPMFYQLDMQERARAPSDPSVRYGLPPPLLTQLEEAATSDDEAAPPAAPAAAAAGAMPCLTEEQLAHLHRHGYVVVDVPPDDVPPPSASIANVSRFFADVSGDDTFQFTRPDDLRRCEARDAAQQYWEPRGNPDPSYFYYTARLDPHDPLNPRASIGRSHNPQRGGKLIAADSGMGPGSTYTSEPGHLQFQFSPYVTGLMQSLYAHRGQTSRVLPVLERMRIKSDAPWSKNTHVDVCGMKLIPHRAWELMQSCLRTM